eukprot:GAHX01000547.1.p1 GENE.GAHX01000547.1~~GAHX01000547.1.p1  ORF type:complete len:487 (-),score=75.83 GAHX01000547.1:100-1560(-)
MATDTELNTNLKSDEAKNDNMARFWFIFSSLLLGPFMFGFSLSGINAVKDNIYSDLDIDSNYMKNLVISIFHVGGIVDSLTIGFFTNYLPRTVIISIASALLTLGFILQAAAVNAFMMLSGRFLAGMASAGYLMIVPVYINETAPKARKGLCGAFLQVSITVGILFGILLNGGPLVQYWRWMAIIPIVTGLYLFLLVLFNVVKKSPVFLLEKGQEIEAIENLRYLRGPQLSEEEIQLFLSESSKDKVVAGMKDDQANSSMFKSRVSLLCIFITIVLQITQQFSGINLILQFSTDIFKKIGFNNDYLLNIMIGSINIFGALVAMFVVDKVGRKVLLLISTCGVLVCYCIITLSESLGLGLLSQTVYFIVQAMGIVLVVFLFNMGLGPIPWMIVSELFPTKDRGLANSINTFANLLFTLVVTVMSSVLLEGNDYSFVFVPFMVWLAFSIPYFMFGIPETKGKNAEEIRENMKKMYKLKKDDKRYEKLL